MTALGLDKYHSLTTVQRLLMILYGGLLMTNDGNKSLVLSEKKWTVS